jgi:hypothetical protein
MEQYLGANDADTSLAYFGYHGSSPMLEPLYAAVKQRLVQLSKETYSCFDGYVRCVVDLAYICESGDRHVVAYRFTSDAAYAKFHRELMELGGSSLARGVWEPFRNSYQFREWLGVRG